MKKISFVTIIGLFIFSAAVLAPAQTEPIVKVKVPFSFYAGNELMPAATYTVRVDEDWGYVTLTNLDQHKSRFLDPVAPAAKFETAPSLEFDKMGNSYFLRSLETGSKEFDFAASKTEKSLARNQGAPPAEGLVAVVPHKSGI